MKKLLIAVCSLLSISLLGGCSVRELPEDGGVDPTIVHTEIVLLPGADMTPFDVPEFSTRAADPREYKVRYIVEVYADDKFDQSLQFRRQLICDEGDTEDVTLECDLHARNYRVSVSAILSCRPFFILIFLLCIKMKHYGFSRKSIWKNLETFP